MINEDILWIDEKTGEIVRGFMDENLEWEALITETILAWLCSLDNGCASCGYAEITYGEACGEL